MCLLVACKNNDDEVVVVEPPIEEPPIVDNGLTFLEPYDQREGDAQAGYEYLIYGDYVDAGVPYEMYMDYIGPSTTNRLNRTGEAANVNYTQNVIQSFNGVQVVSANCLQCHAQTLNGELVVGLGSSIYDYTTDQTSNLNILNALVKANYGETSAEYLSFEPYHRALSAVGPYIQTQVKGVNSADKLAAALAAFRNKNDLTWLGTPQLPIADEVIPTDVPAWWLLKKKNTMFYSGLGRGDFSRIMMASSVLTLRDSSVAREIDQHFVDVRAFINSIEAPTYPEAIDPEKVERGALIFDTNCAGCHGTYGDSETYPNLLVDIEKIGTDAELANANFAYSYFETWYNTSWFAEEPFAAFIKAENGYVAPPLDGIWASAPYLHNGSVPTLEDLLNSAQRPEFWERTFNTSDYNYEKLGWNYEERSAGGVSTIYDTNLRGYGNQGHTFGDHLSEEQRSDLLEYLKTL